MRSTDIPKQFDAIQTNYRYFAKTDKVPSSNWLFASCTLLFQHKMQRQKEKKHSNESFQPQFLFLRKKVKFCSTSSFPESRST